MLLLGKLTAAVSLDVWFVVLQDWSNANKFSSLMKDDDDGDDDDDDEVEEAEETTEEVDK